MSLVGENIRIQREQQGISQNALAKMAGIAQATLNAIERQTKSPNVDTICLISSALKVPVSVLLGERVISSNDLVGDEIILLDAYRQMNQEGKRTAIAILQGLLANPAMRQEESIASMA